MKKLVLVTLPLVLAACGSTGTPGAFVVNVSASKSKVVASTPGATTYTFTNKAGSRAVTIDSATLSWTEPGTQTPHTVTVSIPSFTLPAGLTCPAAATNPSAACNYNEAGTDFGDRSLSRSIGDADLFAKVLAANPSVTDLPVTVQFTNVANTLGFSVTSTASGGTGGDSAPVKAPAPVLTINTAGAQPYSGSLSVTVAGNFDATSTADRVILEVTDARGNVDNTTYTSTSPTATFSIDTAKYADGALALRAIALTKDGLRGETAARTVQVRNVSAPSLAILSPDANATITGPTTVRVQLRQGNTPFTLTPLDGSGNDVRLDVRDFRGQVVKMVYGQAARVSDGVYEAYLPLDLIGSDFSSNSYALETTVQAVLSDGSSRTISAAAQVNTQVNDNKPPALSIVMPAYIVDPYTNSNVRGIFSRNSALMIQASDDLAVTSLRVDFVCDPATAAEGQACPRAPYSYNIPVDSSGVIQRVFEVGALLDAQPYVQNGNYVLRVTAYDGKNANIQEFPVRVSRAAEDSSIAGLDGFVSTTTVPDERPSQLNPTSATWTVPGTTTHPVRVATLAYDNSLNTLTPSRTRIDPELPAGTAISLSQGFKEEGTYRVDFIVEDLVTGVTRYYQGGVVAVKKNPAQ